MIRPSEMDERGLDTARLYAEHHLGKPDWADIILSAYFDPGPALETLAGIGVKEACDLIPCGHGFTEPHLVTAPGMLTDECSGRSS